jgi:hypothetical protein
MSAVFDGVVEGAMLPGEAPGCVTCAACGAPVGAGALAVVPPPTPVFSGLDIGAFGPDGGGAVFPGEAPGLVITGAPGAPVGAGEGDICAKAAPVEMIIAAEARRIDRIIKILSRSIGC